MSGNVAPGFESLGTCAKKESLTLEKSSGEADRSPHPPRSTLTIEKAFKKWYHQSMDDIEKEDPENLPADIEEPESHALNTKYTNDIEESLDMFLEYSKSFPIQLDAVDANSTEEQLKNADAKLLHSMGAAVALGINRVRDIQDIARMTSALARYLRERRALLGFPLDKKQALDFWKPL